MSSGMSSEGFRNNLLHTLDCVSGRGRVGKMCYSPKNIRAAKIVPKTYILQQQKFYDFLQSQLSILSTMVQTYEEKSSDFGMENPLYVVIVGYRK